MRPAKKLLPAAAFCLLLAGSSGAFAAKPANPIEAEREVERAREDFGLRAFLDGAKVWKFLCVIFGAIGLGCVVAFHPLRRRISYDDLDQPKIIITYTVVGALIAIVVAAIPAMGFAVFGIGSVMRFRTELGAAKDTGRVILSTILGLTCGLEMWMVAILGTLIAWVLLALLEFHVGMRMIVRGVKPDDFPRAVSAYSGVLAGLKCSFSSPRKNPQKGQIAFLLHATRGFDPEKIEEACQTQVPAELRGTIDWPEE